MLNAHRVDRELIEHIYEVIYKLSLVIKGTLGKFGQRRKRT